MHGQGERERERERCNLNLLNITYRTAKRSDKDKLPVGRGSGSGAKRPHSSPTLERALTIQAVRQAITPKQQQPAYMHNASKVAQDRMDEASVRRRTTAIVDELVQSEDFKVPLTYMYVHLMRIPCTLTCTV